MPFVYDYIPFVFVSRECKPNSVWSISENSCVSLAQSGCRMLLHLLYYFKNFTLSSLAISARTKLPCKSGCSPPTSNTIISTKYDIRSSQAQLATIVNWNGCESIFVTCPPNSTLMTYNSFTDTYRLYNKTNATVYCGKYEHYYTLYNLTRSKKALCSNTFDSISCIGLFDNKNFNSANNFLFKESNSSSQVFHDQKEMSFCVDILIERKMLEIIIMTERNTKNIYIILIVLAILIFIIIVIVQYNSERLFRLVESVLPESKMKKFIHHYEHWRISRRIVIDYDHCLGKGIWSNVYSGKW